ncbi:PAS domain-containing protein [Ramlibacter montanisoli]|uniref:PAS domain-containing protein n=1 Tax=Ramlibacter montanisoli TaxID=2732512 RepID=A0A849KCV1_9BURK|nr:PAS domain-containing protein [Ramlibacter montanisoli]NNU44324.1 PAS domain-containing protein [Ramlibacter montanisoli]
MTAASLFEHPGLLATAIAEATDDVMFAKDLEGRYRFANPATLAALQRSAEQVLGRTDAEILGDLQAARQLMENDRRVIASGQPTEIEEALRLPDGSVRHWLARKMPCAAPAATSSACWASRATSRSASWPRRSARRPS